MGVKIMIRRKVAKDKEGDLMSFRIQLRALATAQPGYVSGAIYPQKCGDGLMCERGPACRAEPFYGSEAFQRAHGRY